MARTGLLQDANRVGDVDGVAETGVDVDDQRQVDHTTDSHHMIGHLAQVHESEVWQAKVHVGEPSASQIHGPKAEIGDDPGSERVRCAWQNNALLIAKHRAKRLDMRYRHHLAPALRITRSAASPDHEGRGYFPKSGNAADGGSGLWMVG
jgi:hypothetical protein